MVQTLVILLENIDVLLLILDLLSQWFDSGDVVFKVRVRVRIRVRFM